MISILNCDQMYTQCWVNFSDYMMKEFKRWNSVGTCNLKHIEIRAGYLLRVGKVSWWVEIIPYYVLCAMLSACWEILFPN